MNFRNHFIWLVALLLVAFWRVDTARAQDNVLVVEWGDEEGNPIHNALRDAIANDTLRPSDRVYKLKRGGFYWNEDRIEYDGFHLRISGQTEEEADPTDPFAFSEEFCGGDCGPAIIQRVRRGDGSIDGNMIKNTGDGSHLTVENVWLMGQDSDGVLTSYEQISLDAVNARFTFDNVIFDRNNWHFLGPNGENCDMTVTNSLFRNIHGPSQQWEGLGVRFEVGADSVIFENNTFLNIGFTPFQSEAAPMNYFVANHNTFVNVGRTFQAGALWKEAYIANNVFINPFWHGEIPSEYNDPDRDDPFTGFFGISALPARFGTDFDRRIVFVNNSFWRDEALESYADSVRVQPLVNDTTQGYFDAYDNMVLADNFVGSRPDVVTYPDDIIDDMIANIQQLRQGNSASPTYRWDPGRDEECFVCNIWPVPEDFSYTDAAFLDAGTDGLPIGDLNWFPDDKDTYLANRDQNIQDIYDRAGAEVVLDPIALIEGEAGTLDGDAEVFTAQGFTSFFMQGSGKITWTFTVETAGVYGLDVHTNMRSESQRGQHIRVNGTGLKNNSGYGEYYFCTASIDGCAVPLENNAWEVVEIRAVNLVEGADALSLEAGTHTIEIAPSWGWQAFSGVEVINPDGSVLVELSATEAVYEGVEAICESAYCPQYFKSVSLGAGGSVGFAVEAPYDGLFMMRVFYAALDGSSVGQLWVDGESVLQNVSYAATDSSGGDFFTDQFPLSAGAHTVALSSDDGGALIDYVQLIGFGGSTANERNQLPEGYALDQNYPNPFNPTTTITYTLAEPGNVTIEVFDVLGRLVDRLVDGEMASGTHRVSWDGRSLMSSGIYFYRMRTDVGQMTRSMVFMK